MVIQNFNFSVTDEHRKTLGTVSVNKNGELTISSKIVKTLTSSQLATLCRNSLNSFCLLSTGKIAENMFHFSCVEETDRILIKYSAMYKEKNIGIILKKNKHLIFEKEIPQYLRIFCTEEFLNGKKIRYYYNGHYHN